MVLRALLLLIAPVLDGASVNNANDATFAVEKFRIYGREVSSFLGNVMTACRSVNPSGQEVLSNAWAPQGQALRIMLITLRLVTHLPPVCLLSKRWGAEKAEEEEDYDDDDDDADGSDLVDEIVSIYISSRAQSVRGASLRCIERLLLPDVAGSTPTLLFETERETRQFPHNTCLPTAEVVLNRVAAVAASLDVWGLDMWRLRHALNGDPVRHFWHMHEWIAQLCCCALTVHLAHEDLEPSPNEDTDELDTYWADTADVFDNVAFLLMMSPSSEARLGATQLTEHGQRLRKRYESCITAHQSSTKSGFLWDKMEESQLNQCFGADVSEEARLDALMRLARSLDSQVVAFSFSSALSVANADESILASPVVSATELALDCATAVRTHLGVHKSTGGDVDVDANTFLWWQTLFCVGYATLGSRAVIRDCKVRGDKDEEDAEGEGEDEEEDQGKVTATPASTRSILASAASGRIEALAEIVEKQADLDSKHVHKAITRPASNRANSGKSSDPTKPAACANGMCYLGPDGMSAIMRTLVMAAGGISSALVPAMTSALWNKEYLSTQLFGLQKEYGGAGAPGYDASLPRSTLKSKVFQRKWLARRILQRAHVRIAATLVGSTRVDEWQADKTNLKSDDGATEDDGGQSVARAPETVSESKNRGGASKTGGFRREQWSIFASGRSKNEAETNDVAVGSLLNDRSISTSTAGMERDDVYNVYGVTERVAAFIKQMSECLLGLRPNTRILRTETDSCSNAGSSVLNPSVSIRVDFCLVVAGLLCPASLSVLAAGFPCDRLQLAMRDRVAWFEACLSWQGYNDNRCVPFVDASQQCMVALLYGVDFAFAKDSIVWPWIDALLSGGRRCVGARAVAALVESEWALQHTTSTATSEGEGEEGETTPTYNSSALSMCADKCCLGSSATRRAGYTFVTLTALHHWHAIHTTQSANKMPCGAKIVLAGSINAGFVNSAVVRAGGFELLDLSARLLFNGADRDNGGDDKHNGIIEPDFELTICRVVAACKARALKHAWTSVANATSDSISSSERYVLNARTCAVGRAIRSLVFSSMPVPKVGEFAVEMVKQAVQYLCAEDSKCAASCDTPTSSSILRAVRFVRGVIFPWISLCADCANPRRSGSPPVVPIVAAEERGQLSLQLLEMSAQVLETCHVLYKLAWESVEQGRQKVRSEERIASRLAGVALDLVNTAVGVGSRTALETQSLPHRCDANHLEDAPSLTLISGVCVELWQCLLHLPDPLLRAKHLAENVALVAGFLIFNCSAGLNDDGHATVDRKSFAAAIAALYALDPWTTISTLLEHTWNIRSPSFEDVRAGVDVDASLSPLSSWQNRGFAVSPFLHRLTALMLLSELDIRNVCGLNVSPPAAVAVAASANDTGKIVVLGQVIYAACHTLLMLASPAGLEGSYLERGHYASANVTAEMLNADNNRLMRACCSVLLDAMRCFDDDGHGLGGDDAAEPKTQRLQQRLTSLAMGKRPDATVMEIVFAFSNELVGSRTHRPAAKKVAVEGIVRALSMSASLSVVGGVVEDFRVRAGAGDASDGSDGSVVVGRAEIVEIHSAILVASAGIRAFASSSASAANNPDDVESVPTFPATKCLLHLLRTLKRLVYTLKAGACRDKGGSDSETMDEFTVCVTEACVNTFVDLINSRALLPAGSSLLLVPRVLWVAALLLRPGFLKSAPCTVRLFNAGMRLMHGYLCRFDVSQELAADLVMSTRPTWVSDGDDDDTVTTARKDVLFSVLSARTFPGVMHLVGFGVGASCETDTLARQVLLHLLVAHPSMDAFVFSSLPSMRRRLLLCATLLLPWLATAVTQQAINDGTGEGVSVADEVRRCIAVLRGVCQTVHAPELEDALESCTTWMDGRGRKKKKKEGVWFRDAVRAIVAETWAEVMNDVDEECGGAAAGSCHNGKKNKRDGARFAAHCVELLAVRVVAGDVVSYRVPALKLLRCFLIVDGEKKSINKMGHGKTDAVRRAASAVLKGVRDAREGLLETIVQCLLQYVFCEDAAEEEEGRAIAWEIIGCLSSVGEAGEEE